ncbi:MAG: RNA polymerase sigma factor [Planctomycetaceae bacterium]|nr:RNA polymerase sigma factor [Planctomycetaceae bacterium]
MQTSEATDEALMERFQHDLDAAPFQQIVSRFTPPGLAAAFAILCDRALAEDALQEAFLRIVRGAEKYQPSRPFATWFYTVLRNVCVDIIRSRSRQLAAVQEIAARTSPPAAAAPADNSGVDLDLLDTLPRSERAVLMLRVVHEMSFAQVAAITGISEEAAKKRAQRGLGRLRQRLVGRAPKSVPDRSRRA